jgi:hypothetical protein
MSECFETFYFFSLQPARGGTAALSSDSVESYAKEALLKKDILEK